MAARLIIAEGALAIRQMLVRILTHEGYCIAGETGDGETALHLCLSQPADILLLDQSLTRLRGIDVLRNLRVTGQQVKVLVFACADSAPLLREMLFYRPDGFVGKDEPLVTLLEGLRTVEAGHIYLAKSASSQWLNNDDSTVADLTTRELEVIQLVAQSLTSKEIASRLGISLKTVENHRAKVKSKLRSRNSVALTRYAIEHGLIERRE